REVSRSKTSTRQGQHHHRDEAARVAKAAPTEPGRAVVCLHQRQSFGSSFPIFGITLAIQTSAARSQQLAAPSKCTTRACGARSAEKREIIARKRSTLVAIKNQSGFCNR